MKYDKNLYSKDKINEMIFDKSLLNDYQRLLEKRYELIGNIAFWISALLIGIPFCAIVFFMFKALNLEVETLLIGIGILVIGSFVFFIILAVTLAFAHDKIFGKIPSFKEYSEPILLGYELALKRFEVENKVQDYEFMFNNKDFFHGLRIIKDLLQTRQMELSNELAFIPIEKRNRENEIYHTILERKLQNKQQTDWLENQLNNFS